MDHQTAADVIACLPHERTLFYYYRDRYSIGLLRNLARAPLTVAELKRSPFATLANKPRVKEMLARLGGDTLAEPLLALHDHDPEQTAFVLTLGVWGSEHARRWRHKQISRRGFNLVLQLNFCNRHDQLYRRLRPDNDPFSYWGHPNSPHRNTLAWARVDFDLHAGTALIEEIQSDWIREVSWLAGAAQHKLERLRDASKATGLLGLQCPLHTTLEYCRFVLGRYQPVWAEAMLWATLNFLRNELGLRRIFYHTAESGRLLKHIDGTLPPLSLYTDLPRRFCFARSGEIPQFLAAERQASATLKRHPQMQLQRIELP